MTVLLDEAVAREWLSSAYGEDAALVAAGLPAEVRNGVYWDVLTYGPAFQEVGAFFAAVESVKDSDQLQECLQAMWNVDQARPSNEKMRALADAQATYGFYEHPPGVVSPFQYLVHSLDEQAWPVARAGRVNQWQVFLVAVVLSAKYFPETMSHYLTFACDANPALQLLGLPTVDAEDGGERVIVSHAGDDESRQNCC